MKKIIPLTFAKVADRSHCAAYEIDALTASSVRVAQPSAAFLNESVASTKKTDGSGQGVASLQQLLSEFKIDTVSHNGQGEGMQGHGIIHAASMRTSDSCGAVYSPKSHAISAAKARRIDKDSDSRIIS